jgi:hypothetical protein
MTQAIQVVSRHVGARWLVHSAESRPVDARGRSHFIKRNATLLPKPEVSKSLLKSESDHGVILVA